MLTASTLDDTCRLCENSTTASEGVNIPPHLVACLIRVDGRDTGISVDECMRETRDAVPIGLQTCSHDKILI